MGEKVSDALRFYIKTYGCQMNVRDSEKVYCILREAGYEPVDSPDKADIVVVNSCAVREKAEGKIYSEIGRLRRMNPKARIVSMGCVAQFNHEKLRKLSSAVVGTSKIDSFYKMAHSGRFEGVYVDERMSDPDHIFPHKPSVSNFIDIMYGCNNFCSYCIVPYTRGREVSRSPKAILDEIKRLVDSGTKEVMLLGQNVNSYNALKGGFVELLELVNGVKGLKRIRFTTSHPKDFSIELIKAMRDLDKVCEHIHLPLQSGSDRILRLMGRRYTAAEYLEKAMLFREMIPEGSITTDIIVGFPGESDEDFRKTLQIVKTVQYDTSFSFKYSPRPLTRAAKMEGHLPEDVKLERLNELQELQASITQKRLKEAVGKSFEVLVEGPALKGEMMSGRNRQNVVVNFRFKDNIKEGDLVEVRITKALKHSLVGEVSC